MSEATPYDVLYASACMTVELTTGGDTSWLGWLQEKQPGHYDLLNAIVLQTQKASQQQWPLVVFDGLLAMFVSAHRYTHAIWLAGVEAEITPTGPDIPPDWKN